MPLLAISVQGVEIQRVQLNKARTVLGRKPDNDIVLDNMTVSGHHCAFDLVGLADVFVRDLGSTNGTYVNDRMAKVPTLLADGDVLAIGPFRLRYQQTAERPSGFGETSTQSFDSPVALYANFQILNGSSQGLEVPVVKAVTTFGKPGKCVVAVSHRRMGYFVAQLDGDVPALLNGVALSAEPRALAHDDVLDLAGTTMQFQLGG